MTEAKDDAGADLKPAQRPVGDEEPVEFPGVVRHVSNNVVEAVPRSGDVMTQPFESRAFRYARIAAGVVLFFVLWTPASWLAGRFVPVDWPTHPVSGAEAVNRLTRQVNANYWLTYGIWAALWLLVLFAAGAARRRWTAPHHQRQSEAAPGATSPSR